MSLPWFDRYLMVDWSANNVPKRGKDSIWAALGCWTEGLFEEKRPVNLSTRVEAMRYVSEVIEESLANGQRLLLGFDFPYSYPTGMTQAAPDIFDPGPQWRSIWTAFASRITDDAKNTNNRFQVADDINRLSGTRFFWGRPRGAAYEAFVHLPERDEIPAGLRTNPCGRWRLVDSTVSSGIKSVWQIFAGVTVGGQTLMGIPHLEALRLSFPRQMAVWPFETGIQPDRSTFDRPVTLVEIWPSAVPVDLTLELVADAAQVRSVVRWCAQRDTESDWGRWLGPATARLHESQVADEGWILGVE